MVSGVETDSRANAPGMQCVDQRDGLIVAPNIRDLHKLAHRLAGWLESRIDGAHDIRLSNISYPRGAGLSHETILFDASWTEAGRPVRKGMVVRIKPTSGTVFLDDLFEQQYQVMQLMHSTGFVRVAEPYWFEADAELLGAPFFVMEKRAGRVAVSYPPYLSEGWLFDATPQQRMTLWEDAVRQLAAIARVPVSSASFLGATGNPMDGFDQEWERWRRIFEWISTPRRLPNLDIAWEKLRASLPANRPEGIVWGDARIGNMLVGEDFRIVAVMDWEHPSLGGALHDLGWWLFTNRLHTVGRNLRPLEGMGTREQTIALWEEASGLSAADIDWYEQFGAFKLACLEARMFITKGNAAPGNNPGDNASSRLLAQMLGQDAPTTLY